ncbi:putative fasciclin-like arabinogalactan protein [Rosa chinensis]|uniref:Putative fasciclin-like arabinogalactan protein n=1 Tax=Rosa chinensis TaxID=74649 RepID=A0A2P6RV50_ROSCH|nr:putative fasciclin-like arabinogalactan protein [Rosa chinensis]
MFNSPQFAKMYFPISTLLLSSFLFSCSSAFNITNILNDHKDFSTFNDYLTRTTVADQINKRESLTIFVVDNGGMGSVTGKSLDMVAKILSLHVALEYFDTSKLQHLPTDQPTLLTTLLQANGQATGQQGFLKATIGGNSSEGGVTISSASSSDQSAHVVSSVTSQPYNISVIQISNAIMPNIISPPAAAPTHLPSKSPANSPKSASPKGLLDSPNVAPGTGTAASPDAKSSGTSVFSVTYAFVISVVLLSTLSLMRLP